MPANAGQSSVKGPYTHFACLSLIYSIFIRVTDNYFPKHTTGNSELKMFFLPSRPPLVSVHSGTLLKSTC
ncbi:hypothetical protein LDENG_00273650 [Lucifuga dentata]|nr:hypothetical protein LDENG_00273650 [Lucifuga dentata]